MYTPFMYNGINSANNSKDVLLLNSLIPTIPHYNGLLCYFGYNLSIAYR